MKSNIFCCCFSLFVFNVWPPCILAANDLFFPHGLAAGDEFLAANDDGSTAELPIRVTFPFFDHDHRSLFVNNNGVISFLVRVSQFTPDPFPLGDGRRLITPFWGDVDTNHGGTVSYREVLRFDHDDALFVDADIIIRNAFVNARQFTSSWMFIATWDEVAFYGTNDNNITNSFQAVLVTDGLMSFTIFNYGDIEWTTGTASGGDSLTGRGGTPAQVGFNAGDGITAYVVPGSRTDAVVDIEETTNVNTRGRWVFRTDNADINGLECTPSGDVTVFPLVGTMLGGTQVFITGPCFNDTSQVVCDFDGEEVEGYVLSNTSSLCVTPTFYKVGQIPVRVSSDNGVTFDFQGDFVIINVEEVPARVHSSATVSDHRLTDLEITWDPDILDLVERVDIVVYGYREGNNHAEFDGPVIILAENVTYELGMKAVSITSNDELEFEIGVFGLIQSGDLKRSSARAAQWSDVHVLQWYHGRDTVGKCQDWVNEEISTNDRAFFDVTAPCPCNLDQALLDVGRFSPHPWCSLANNCSHRPEAHHCVRANIPSELGGGQECCYDSDGGIINSLLAPGGGYIHRYHHSGVEPYGQPTKVPYLSHYLADILPWSYCCMYTLPELTDDCKLYGLQRPSHTCNDYIPPPPALGNGDPHIATLDVAMYTFNGYGEFVMLDALNGTFTLQARIAPLPTMIAVQATVFIAVAARYAQSDVIHIQTNERRVLDCYVKRGGETDFTRVDFNQASGWMFTGVTVSGPNIAEDGITVAFDEGVGLKLTASEGAMSIVLLPPDHFLGQTKGLMGTWNGNASDDFVTPDGQVLSADLSTEDLHSQFGLEWEVAATDSLFFYEPGNDHESHTNRSYQPVFEPVINPAVNQSAVEEVCGTNQFCIFDFQTTGSQTFAQDSVNTFEQYEEARESVSAFVSCPTLSSPDNGSVVVSGYIPGGFATYLCDEGFELSNLEVNLTCLFNGTWSDGETPDCFEVTAQSASPATLTGESTPATPTTALGTSPPTTPLGTSSPTIPLRESTPATSPEQSIPTTGQSTLAGVLSTSVTLEASSRDGSRTDHPVETTTAWPDQQTTDGNVNPETTTEQPTSKPTSTPGLPVWALVLISLGSLAVAAGVTSAIFCFCTNKEETKIDPADKKPEAQDVTHENPTFITVETVE